MIDYSELLAYMEMADNQDPPSGTLMSTGEETRSMQTIRAGMNLKENDDESFWMDFMKLCSDSEGMSELLGVKEVEVRSWAAKVREALEKVKESNRQNPEGQDDKKVMPTGDNDGSMTVNDRGELKV